MFFKLSLSLLLLISVRVSEGDQHSKERHNARASRSSAGTIAAKYLECDVEKRLTFVPVGEQVTVVSPNWPSNYGRWEHCGWRFWTMFGATLTFFCDEVKLSKGDPLQVYQDLTHNGALKNVYSMANGTLHFQDGSVNVEFSSSFFNGNSGFKCHVQSKSKITTPAPTTTVKSGQKLPAGGQVEKPIPEPEHPVPETQPEGPLAGIEKPAPEPENPMPETQPEGPPAEIEKPAPEPENPVPETQPEEPPTEIEKPAPEPENPMPETQPERPPAEIEKPAPEPENPVPETQPEGPPAEIGKPEPENPVVETKPEGPPTEIEEPAHEPENPVPETQPEGPPAEIEKPTPEPENPVPESQSEKPAPEQVLPGNEDLANGGDKSPVEPEEPIAEATTGASSAGDGPVLQCSGVQSGIFVEPGRSVTLVSPGYPDKYPIRTKCGWNLKSSQGVVLQVSCGFFSLNKKDVLLLAHGPRANQHRFILDKGPRHKRFSKGRLLVRFSSNRNTVGAGFSCTVTAEN